MKKIIILFLVLISINAFSKILIIEGNYKGFNNKILKKQWKVKLEGDSAKFFLNGKYKAKMEIKNGKIVRIEEIKKFAGKERVFIVTKPQHIKLELKANFYPFLPVFNYMNKKTIKVANTPIFKILEVKER
ncbi:hypothetical protein TTHT_0450 [Thermotomaculum hydrothermale]|uniref:Uncharacterized protein n=1 Tax=Thermotomaculum hydrothermale TaxID=981385 RepID=A0A7R6PE32_9BACT|nr:hypothetical protein [Thermotomaculum hydrothermale]BBB32044.1 hypothetical protein TTHT_0450 [Thermotomaculum hydrothermale]